MAVKISCFPRITQGFGVERGEVMNEGDNLILNAIEKERKHKKKLLVETLRAFWRWMSRAQSTCSLGISLLDRTIGQDKGIRTRP